MLKDSITIEIPELEIKAPVIDGTEKEILSIAAGHFPGTGAPGKGNYCIAGHSSTIYAEIFNNLRYIENGMEVILTDNSENVYRYTVFQNFIVKPEESWILNDFEDDRITIVTCTDDGTERQVVVGKLN